MLPTLGKVDAVVADPPYGIDGSSGTMNLARGKDRFLANDTGDNLIRVVIPSVIESLALAQRGVITPGGKHAWKYPEPVTIGFIYQPASVSLCSWGAVTCQPVLFYGRDPRLGKAIGRLVYQCTDPAEECGHPCPKPIGVALWMVGRGSIEGETILDPFMGSGTTGVACARLGRNFIGIEIEEKYFQLAVKRIEAEVNSRPMFEEPVKPKPVEMFA